MQPFVNEYLVGCVCGTKGGRLPELAVMLSTPNKTAPVLIRWGFLPLLCVRSSARDKDSLTDVRLISGANLEAVNPLTHTDTK